MNTRHCHTIGLYIALQEEYDYFLKCVKKQLNITQIDDLPDYPVFLIRLKHSNVRLVVICPDEMGIETAQFNANKLLEKAPFEAMFNIGIAGGISDDIKVGEILVPSVIDNYMANAKVTDGENGINYDFSGDPYKPSYAYHEKIISSLKLTNGWFEDWLTYCSQNTKDEIGESIPDEISNLISLQPFIKGGRLASQSILGASEKFKEILKRNRDRKYLGLDMEAAGVAKACHQRLMPVPFLAIKPISDPASKKDKVLLESFKSGIFRKLGIMNATFLFLHILEDISGFWTNVDNDPSIHISPIDYKSEDDSIESSGDLSVFMNSLYEEIKINDLDDTDVYGEYFSKTVKGQNYDNKIFKDTCKNIITRQNAFPLNVVADKGCGKSSFLAILFKALCLANKDRGPVLYINFRRLLRSNKKTEDSINSVSGVIDSFLNSAKDSETIFILDDIEYVEDREDRFSEWTREFLRKINDLSAKKVIFGSRKAIRAGYPAVIANKITPNIHSQIYLTSVTQRNESYDSLLDSFIRISQQHIGDRKKEDLFRNRIKGLNIYNLDLFIISNIYSTISSVAYSEVDTLSEYLELYCNQVLSSDSSLPRVSLDKLSRYVFDKFVSSDEVGLDKVELKVKVKKLVDNKLIRDFLVAFHGVNALNNYSLDQDNLDVFSYVFPDTVDHFFKELIRIETSKQTHTFRQIQFLSKNLKARIVSSKDDEQNRYIRGLTHCAYLVGRLDFDKDAIQKYLNELLREIETKNTYGGIFDEPDYGLLIRTIYISLACADHKNATDQYVSRLTKSKHEDDLNRGFHLEYYGDQEYIPQYGMNHKDNLEDCSMTFTHLSRKISDHIKMQGIKDPLFDIEFHTLLSLVQNRLKMNYFESYKKPALDILYVVEKSRVVKNDDLKQYMAYMKNFLETDSYDCIHVMRDVYNLKTIVRTGWLKRMEDLGIRLESVAEHTFGACFLAYFFLEENTSIEESKVINKNEVIKMLLIHDIAECYVGDVVNKTEAQKLEEKRAIERISFVGTNHGLPNHREIADLFYKMEGAETIEGKIARDFDKLENLIQLHLYRNHLKHNDFLEFQSALHDDITTEFVRKVGTSIEDYFHDNK